MERIRVFICDDSVLIRKLLTISLADDKAIELVGSAPNGKQAVTKVPEANPDVVVMDVEMPEMNGIDAVKALRAGGFKRPIVMFSTLTNRGDATTIEALTRGANAYVYKPNQGQNATEAVNDIRKNLIPKIKELAAARAR